ncbi:MAG TPA: helix-turn-helix domain-containing protein [Gallionellaceae bacterium]|nr:helix-turn-helix domain-containing protein [Gallionellaceae bacterium]
MAESSKAGASNIVLLPQKVSSRSSEKKWGKAVCNLGFSIIPSLIFRAQARLGLNATQLAVLLQLADYWWDQERHPYPSKTTLGERLQLGPRQVQRYIAELEEAGFVKRIERYAQHKGRLINHYDLSGLVAKLKKLEPEFREAEERRKQVSKRGGLRNMKQLEQ